MAAYFTDRYFVFLAGLGVPGYVLTSTHEVAEQMRAKARGLSDDRARSVLGLVATVERALLRPSALSLAKTRALTREANAVYQAVPAHGWHRHVIRALAIRERAIRGQEEPEINVPSWRPIDG